jgi:hypothetical protein
MGTDPWSRAVVAVSRTVPTRLISSQEGVSRVLAEADDGEREIAVRRGELPGDHLPPDDVDPATTFLAASASDAGGRQWRRCLSRG